MLSSDWSLRASASNIRSARNRRSSRTLPRRPSGTCQRSRQSSWRGYRRALPPWLRASGKGARLWSQVATTRLGCNRRRLRATGRKGSYPLMAAGNPPLPLRPRLSIMKRRNRMNGVAPDELISRRHAMAFHTSGFGQLHPLVGQNARTDLPANWHRCRWIGTSLPTPDFHHNDSTIVFLRKAAADDRAVRIGYFVD